jgi:hypothetical protein
VTDNKNPVTEGEVTEKQQTFQDCRRRIIDENTIQLNYKSLPLYNPFHLITGPFRLTLKINDEYPIVQDVHMGEHKFTVEFKCKKYNFLRKCEVTAKLKFWTVKYYLKVDGKDYDFYQVFYSNLRSNPPQEW